MASETPSRRVISFRRDRHDSKTISPPATELLLLAFDRILQKWNLQKERFADKVRSAIDCFTFVQWSHMLQTLFTEQVHAHIDIETMSSLCNIDAELSKGCVLLRL